MSHLPRVEVQMTPNLKFSAARFLMTWSFIRFYTNQSKVHVIQKMKSVKTIFSITACPMCVMPIIRVEASSMLSLNTTCNRFDQTIENMQAGTVLRHLKCHMFSYCEFGNPTPQLTNYSSTNVQINRLWYVTLVQQDSLSHRVWMGFQQPRVNNKERCHFSTFSSTP